MDLLDALFCRSWNAYLLVAKNNILRQLELQEFCKEWIKAQTTMTITMASPYSMCIIKNTAKRTPVEAIKDDDLLNDQQIQLASAPGATGCFMKRFLIYIEQTTDKGCPSGGP
jgi:hypothetical protein